MRCDVIEDKTLPVRYPLSYPDLEAFNKWVKQVGEIVPVVFIDKAQLQLRLGKKKTYIDEHKNDDFFPRKIHMGRSLRYAKHEVDCYMWMVYTFADMLDRKKAA